MRKTILAVCLAVLAANAGAEVYQWRDAAGKTRISNVAPPWYTDSGRVSPRVQVLVNGILVDDTGLPDEQRNKLREGRPRAEAWGRRPDPPRPVAIPGFPTAPVKPAAVSAAAPAPAAAPKPPALAGDPASKAAGPQLPPVPQEPPKPPAAEAKK